jgi:hypothetical protein
MLWVASAFSTTPGVGARASATPSSAPSSVAVFQR